VFDGIYYQILNIIHGNVLNVIELYCEYILFIFNVFFHIKLILYVLNSLYIIIILPNSY